MLPNVADLIGALTDMTSSFSNGAPPPSKPARIAGKKNKYNNLSCEVTKTDLTLAVWAFKVKVQ